ncbi:MAG TPA: S53 family peptidase [Holophagaceae bacterium]|jgi:kumamolisin|nr:S53 family peptidase [Holophagaceae bacterium]
MNPRTVLSTALVHLPEIHEPVEECAEVGLSLVLASADEGDRVAVTAFVKAQSLRVAAWMPRTRRLKVCGTARDMSAAFGLHWVRSAEGHLLGAGEPSVPAELGAHLHGVLGLDPRPKLRPHLKSKTYGEAAAPKEAGMAAPAFAQRYQFPEGDGKGQHVGLLQLGGALHEADLAAYFDALDLAVPSITVTPVSGGDPSPTKDSRWEMTLDVEVLGAVVPAAKITVFIAPNNSDGLLDLVEAALHGGADQPSVLSMSWGAAESEWGELELQLVSDALQGASKLGVTVLVSSGDEGSTDGAKDGKQHVAFPASSPWVLGVGGTQQAGGLEVVWNALPDKGATGGGVSEFFALPEWQRHAGVPRSANDGAIRRGVPDLAAHAAEEGGYRVFVDGVWRVLGGTSAAAPLLAGLITRINAKRKKPLGYLNPLVYGVAHSALKPITEGTNGAYKATAGYSACTGLGVADGGALLKKLAD